MFCDEGFAVVELAEFAQRAYSSGLCAAPNGVKRSMKQLTSLRLDPDVLAWFKAQGKGYQTRMNAVLRAYMKAQTR